MDNKFILISMNIIFKAFTHFIVILLILINLSKSQVINNNKSNDKAFIKALNDLVKSEDKSHSLSVLPSVLLVNAKQFQNTNCENERLFESRGSISSPNYPNGYQNRTSCMWFIIGSNPNDIITISFDDLDLEVPIDSPKYCAENPTESSLSTDEDLCCAYTWIKIGSTLDHEQRYCGRSEDNSLALKPFISQSNRLSIKFHTAVKVKGGRGFHLSYIVGPPKSAKCKSDEFHCENGKCILSNWKCNGRNECGDGSDERNCDDICLGANQVKCGSVSNHNRGAAGCYSFPKERCDFIWNCENGADERGCGGCPNDMFVCRTGRSCFSETKKCDGIMDCLDFTDELNCGFCGHNKTLCGTNSLTQCYDPFTSKCNRILDCPNGEDEIGCIHGCHNKILCSSGSGCYSPEERCNGVPECNDYSDEKNCSLDLCKAERGSFLCSNGRCIRAVWKCDGQNDCLDSSDELNCLKNSVITAAIMGSLICGLLLVIAISCTCKLIALRQVERHSSTHTSPSHISHNYDRNFSVNGFTGDSDTPLFRLEHGFFFRDPPPSYATAVGGYQSDRSNSYIEQIRQIRRQRRLRRNRRRPPTPPPIDFNEGENSETISNSSITPAVISNSGVSTTTSSPTTIGDSQIQIETNNHKNETSKDEVSHSSANESSNCEPINSISSSNDVNIELENIPSLSQSDCDSQPLIR